MSAEIPPAGAPFGVRLNAAGVCSEMTQWVWRFVGCNLFVAMFLWWIGRSKSFAECGYRACLVVLKPFLMLIVMWVPRSRLRAPLRGSTPRRVGAVLLVFLPVVPLRSG